MRAPSTSDGGHDAPWWLALGALFLLLCALIRPAGEFPLNDDWSYSRAVRTWLETGHLRFTGWTSVPLVAHAAWGALFCLPAGFSFGTLRVATAAAGLLGVWGMFFLARSAGAGRPAAAAAAATLAVNPLYVHLSQTFMTDVPFTAAATWALAGFLRALTDPRRRWLALGLLGSLAAALTRHVGLIPPLAFLLAACARPRDVARPRNWLPAAAVALALFGFCAYGAARLNLRPFWASQSGRLAESLGAPGGLARILERAGEIAIYLGLFALPYEAFVLAGAARRQAVARLAMALAAGALVAAGLAALGVRLPLAGNVLYDTGLGPVRLYDHITRGLPHGFAAPAGVWTLATGLGVAGAVLGGIRWRAAWRQPAGTRDTARATRRLAGWSAAGWLAPMLAAGYFDRYLLVLLPLWLLGAPAAAEPVSPRAQPLPAVATLLAALWAAFAVAATRDYFAWNRARWAALHDLVERAGVAPGRIDGGFEFNGWYGYDPAWPADRQPPPDRSWWWVADDEYVITLGPVPGYTEQACYPFTRWLGRAPGAVRVLHRDAAAPR